MQEQRINKPIKVLQFICSTGFYGAERWILALVNNSKALNVDYSLAVTLEAGTEDLELVGEFKKTGGDVIQVPMSNRFDFGIIDKLVAYIEQNNIDILHTHGYKSDILGVLAARKTNVKVVVTPHGFENTRDIKLRFFIWLGCLAMRFADRVVPLSQQLMRDVKKYGIKAPRLAYIQNGVDLSEVDAVRQAPAKLPKTKKRVGFIGQMISRKNIDDILYIFDELSKTRDDIELVLLGDGDSRAALEVKSQTLASADNISFLGYRDDRLDYLKSFDLFVMTSSLEGIPRCLMEACAMGTPVAAYNIPGIDQLISHNQTGLLAQPSDKKTLLTYWQRLLDDKELALQLGNNARDYVNEYFSGKRMAIEYAELFTELLSEQQGST